MVALSGVGVDQDDFLEADDLLADVRAIVWEPLKLRVGVLLEVVETEVVEVEDWLEFAVSFAKRRDTWLIRVLSWRRRERL
ncbi:MAG: hypothetical protein Aurels2KO_58220 [Aureliella sp.]